MYGLYTAVLRAPPPHYHRKITIFRGTLDTNDLTSKSLDKYLRLYAEPEIRQLDSFPCETSYQNVLVIPAYLENSDFLHRLERHLPESTGKILLVLVSNHPQGLPHSEQEKALSAHQDLLNTLGRHTWDHGQLALFRRKLYDILWVDRTGQHALPKDQAVGLARKTGADLALSLIQKTLILSPWIMSTDADAFLPPDYFSINPGDNTSALAYPFVHLCHDTALGRATQMYELSIKHYVKGLSYAGSDYAFSTLGSCLAVHAEYYAQVRGFPKRSAGEDFYLLNKLAKLGKIEQGEHLPLIKICARASERVPFGTGPAVKKLLNSPDIHREPLFYNPDIFVELKQVLVELRKQPKQLEEICLSKDSLSVLSSLGIEGALDHAQRQKLTGRQYDRHIKGWFDGFKTLKFVHGLRDTLDKDSKSLYPNLSYKDLIDLDSCPF